MRIVLLDASEADDARTRHAADVLADSLASCGADVERIVVRELEVRACTGCFGCWTKSPGECVIGDDARSVAERAIAADAFAIVTPIAFGSYGWRAKSVLDRLICLVLPHFTMIEGEVHHRPRYPRYPHLLALGTLRKESPEQAALFARLVERNAVNLHNPTHAVAVVVADESPVVAAKGLTDRLVVGADGHAIAVGGVTRDGKEVAA